MKKKVLITAAIALAAIGMLSQARAATPEQIESALDDLSDAIGQKVSSADQARILCDQEQYLTACAEIGKRHNLYDQAEMKQVDTLLAEMKGTISEQLKTCQDTECLLKVATELAQNLDQRDPQLASQLSLTPTAVKDREGVVVAAREAGVSFETCHAMNPDTAPVELLRTCARLAKDPRVQKYIPPEARERAGNSGDTTVELREALAAGQYQCGDGTLEGCGNFCLNPSVEARGRGTPAIPPVCRQIAARFFGPEGIRHLEDTHQHIRQIKASHETTIVLVLPNGKELSGKDAIQDACGDAFEKGDLATASACGDLAVKNGFASPEEVAKGLKTLEAFAQSGGEVDFDQCVANPQACAQFISNEDRQEFKDVRRHADQGEERFKEYNESFQLPSSEQPRPSEMMTPFPTHESVPIFTSEFTPPPSTHAEPDPAAECAKAGGSWTGDSCSFLRQSILGLIFRLFLR